MNDRELIKNDSFFLKLKRKIFEIIKETKRPKQEVREEQKVTYLEKEKILNLYKDSKNNRIDLNMLSEKELNMLIKLADEEINILKYKLENEITESKIIERRIQYYQNKLNN